MIFFTSVILPFNSTTSMWLFFKKNNLNFFIDSLNFMKHCHHILLYFFKHRFLLVPEYIYNGSFEVFSY